MTDSLSARFAEVDERIDDRRAVRRQFPPPDLSLSLLEALGDRRCAPDGRTAEQGKVIRRELEQVRAQVRNLDESVRCPLVAVAGGLNAGKSSLVATFLSPAGQRRVLRGVSNRHGTHRFVLWLPAVWRDDAQLTAGLSRNLESLLGRPVEWLAEDPQRAMEQYNAPDTDIPLLAFDERLDALSVGLVDCPDVQTGILPGKGGGEVGVVEALPSRRQQLLRDVGKACSAFILVTNARFLRDATVGQIYSKLVEAMPRAKRFLALNRVDVKLDPETLRQDIASFLIQYPCTGVYMAYRFDSPKYAELPAAWRCARPAEPRDRADGLPCFFRLPPDRPFDAERIEYLSAIGRRLDAGVLSRDRRRSVVRSFVDQVHRSREWIEDAANRQAERAAAAQRAVWRACVQELGDPDHRQRFRIQASETVAKQYSLALRNTAPSYLRWTFAAMDPVQWAYKRIGETVAAAGEKVGNWKGGLVPGWIQGGMRKTRQRLPESNVIRPSEIVDAIRDADTQGAFAEYDDAQLTEAVETAMKRFTEKDPTELPTQELETWCRHYWKNISGKKKLSMVAKPIAILAAPIVAVLMIPFDFGGTAVIAAASVKELLIALGISAVGVALGGDDTFQLAIEGVGRQQAINMLAILCDCLCVPRPSDEQLEDWQQGRGVEHLRVLPTIPDQPREIEHGIHLWRIDSEWRGELESDLHALLAEPE